MVENQPYIHSAKKGICYGAFSGFIAAIAFAGVMLWLPVISHLPIGTFLEALGLLLVTSTASGPIAFGLTAFGIILVQCILVGIIFGILTSKSKRLHTSDKKRGIMLGLTAGVIAYLVLFVPVTYTIYLTFLAKTITSFPQTILFSIQGTQEYENITSNNIAQGSVLLTMLGYGLFAYLIFGFILGGIFRWIDSVYAFDLTKLEQLEKMK
jgi:hypothetical protein